MNVIFLKKKKTTQLYDGSESLITCFEFIETSEAGKLASR